MKDKKFITRVISLAITGLFAFSQAGAAADFSYGLRLEKLEGLEKNTQVKTWKKPQQAVNPEGLVVELEPAVTYNLTLVLEEALKLAETLIVDKDEDGEITVEDAIALGAEALIKITAQSGADKAAAIFANLCQADPRLAANIFNDLNNQPTDTLAFQLRNYLYTNLCLSSTQLLNLVSAKNDNEDYIIDNYYAATLVKHQIGLNQTEDWGSAIAQVLSASGRAAELLSAKHATLGDPAFTNEAIANILGSMEIKVVTVTASGEAGTPVAQIDTSVRDDKLMIIEKTPSLAPGVFNLDFLTGTITYNSALGETVIAPEQNTAYLEAIKNIIGILERQAAKETVVTDLQKLQLLIGYLGNLR